MRRILKKNINCKNTNPFITAAFHKYISNVAYITAQTSLKEYVLTISRTRK